ncbi:MAG: hypothetical protein NTU53_16410 [Planctomycetota bacterium]|nr:hypothetical protein [Planctomycetota bacterium]
MTNLLQQWRKRYQGETYYLGTGNGRTDTESYRNCPYADARVHS